MPITCSSKLSILVVTALQISAWFVPEVTAPLPPAGDKYHDRIASLGDPSKHAKRALPTVTEAIPTLELLAGTPVNPLNRYIVILRDQTNVTKFVSALKKSFESDDDASLYKNKVGYVYDDTLLRGFSVELKRKAFEQLSRSADVLEIIDDTTMSIQPIEDAVFDQLPVSPVEHRSSNSSTVNADAVSNGYVQQGSAPWGLQRVDQRTKISNNGASAAAVTYDYPYSKFAGQGVTVYVLDTGVRASHDDFDGRAEMAAQFGGYAMADGNGHGTHCAGTIGGSRWGVAKQVRIRGVKVLADDGSGSTSDVIAGIQYTLRQYQASGYKPTVASLSLGGEKNSALDRVVQAAVNQGVHFVVAAGNSNVDACGSSPASVSGANVVAASDVRDNRASYSNWGTCVDVIAPGSDVTSAWYTADDATKRISGTSMAAPHVAGLIAAHLSRQNVTTQQMSEKIRRDATPNVIFLGPRDSGAAATPNFLLYNTLQ